jgi:hypothetical protein
VNLTAMKAPTRPSTANTLLTGFLKAPANGCVCGAGQGCHSGAS